MTRHKVLFLCVANSARSQLAQALARHLFGKAIHAQSAGSAPGGVHPLARRVLEEIGLPTQGLTSKHVDSIDPSTVDLVITLCADQQCPVFLGDAQRRSWAMPDPADCDPATPEEERLLGFRAARDQIHARLLALGRELGIQPAAAGISEQPAAAPIVAIVGWKNSGKTTLVERVVSELADRGLRVGTVKATHHDIEPDPEGKDSWRHRRAGATETLLVGPNRWVLTHEGHVPFHTAITRLIDVDIIVVEGMRGARLPKVEVVSPDSQRPLLAPGDPDIHLVAADRPIGPIGVPVLPRDDIAGIADAVLDMAGPQPGAE
ncbi:MAG: molybdopterin-guanine dinucleotide biosynthesis protein B [Oligoflexia bacterium]|nr:molybdopterin-guanine dinucleotide biosynthesis protein B [Oligoflexia bacterium]